MQEQIYTYKSISCSVVVTHLVLCSYTYTDIILLQCIFTDYGEVKAILEVPNLVGKHVIRWWDKIYGVA